MKDGLLLLVTGIICSLGAWLFFKFFGSEAFIVIMMMTMVSAVLDNVRLRRKLRELTGEQ
ncbi:hypothetical protein GTP45_23030 [Pseudoduganella sp. FT55W]|uniref:Uncharacterized protein n=1 Tax=Duganella rivi TaxID=2666083 RepID=A0A7X4GV29_9BURK|nr:hypothetical protein [Duganella rivi]MYM69694.1 hypothetical protein [Duganella rivi]